MSASSRVLSLAAFALVGGASCTAPRHEQGWRGLHAGLSHAEVRELLGDPSSTYVPPPPVDGGARTGDASPRGSRGERWQYGDTLSSLATRAVFPDEADERAWCVFFGADGRVNGFRPPRWATGFAELDPADRPAATPPAR
jgi:hypothetical protein